MPQWMSVALEALKDKAAKIFDSSDPSIDFSHVVLTVAFAFSTYWLTRTLSENKWVLTAAWASAFATYMGAIFAKGIWGKDGK